MPTSAFKRFKSLTWSDKVFTAAAASFMLFVLAFAALELLLRPGAIFRTVTPQSAVVTGGVIASASSATASDPYASVLDRFKSSKERKKEEDDAREKAKKLLEKSVLTSLAQAEDKLGKLTEENAAFEHEVLKVVGASVDSERMPDDFARLLATRETAAEAWASIKNDHLSPDAVRSLRAPIDAVDARTKAGIFLEDDQERLAKAIENLDSRLVKQHDLEGSLDHLRAMLEIDRFQAPK